VDSKNKRGPVIIFATIVDYSCAEMPDKDETASTSLRTIIDSANAEWDDVVFMEQEETRSIRIPEWLFIRRFEPTPYEFGHLLYDLANDPDERNNVAEEPEYQAIVEVLCACLDEQFEKYSDPKWNLWKGGKVKSNSTRPFLWQAVWGEDWKPAF